MFLGGAMQFVVAVPVAVSSFCYAWPTCRRTGMSAAFHTSEHSGKAAAYLWCEELRVHDAMHWFMKGIHGNTDFFFFFSLCQLLFPTGFLINKYCHSLTVVS